MGKSHNIDDKGDFKSWYNGKGKSAFKNTSDYKNINSSQNRFENNVKDAMNASMKDSLKDFQKMEKESKDMYKMLDNMVKDSKR